MQDWVKNQNYLTSSSSHFSNYVTLSSDQEVSNKTLKDCNVDLDVTMSMTFTEITSNDLLFNFVAMCHGNGKFVAMTDAGDTISSSDGNTWTKSQIITVSQLMQNWKWICYADNQFVALNSGAAVAFSTDGTTWNVDTCKGSHGGAFNSFCYGNGIFVAVDKNSNIIYSEDAITWSQSGEVAPTASAFLYYGGGYFIVMHNTQPGVVNYSTDGIHWTWNNVYSGVMSATVTSMCYGNGYYVAVCNSSRNFIYTNDPTGAWTKGSFPMSGFWKSVAFGGGTFAAIEDTGTLVYTTDLTGVWNMDSKAKIYALICYGDGNFVAVGNGCAMYTSNMNPIQSLSSMLTSILSRLTALESS